MDAGIVAFIVLKDPTAVASQNACFESAKVGVAHKHQLCKTNVFRLP